MTIKKIAAFTDIHWGAKSNLLLHNQDCLAYIKWFIVEAVKAKVDSIAFLGDWFETRNAINIETNDYSYDALKLLNDVGLPIYFVVGNHDLYRRNTRDVHSVRIFNEFKNIVVIDKLTVVDDFLFAPFLFKEEYALLGKYTNCKVWAGHFEFKDFILTGANMRAEHGLNHKLFKDVQHIFSGHYHKRQAIDNVCYIGNTFPTNYGDAGDINRGMMIYDHINDEVDFIDYIGPTYLRTTLSKALADEWQLPPSDMMRVICTNDIEISYSEAQIIRETLKDQYNFREFRLDENYSEKKDALTSSETEDIDKSMSIDEIVIQSLNDISEIKSIDNNKLVSLYKSL
jgi:DNA repair exonuclease SbcCD nuclease subunit